MKFKLSHIENEIKRQSQKIEIPAEEINEQIMRTISSLKDRGIKEKNQKIFTSMVQYLAETKLECRKKGLLLFGDTGTGKTFSAKIIAAFRDIHFYTCDELMRVYQNNKDLFWEIIDKKKDLIIDDLGAEPTMNDYGMRFELFSQAIATRHRLFEYYGVRTIVTTNLSGKAIKERYSERIYSRFKQMCECINATGEDLRVPERKVTFNYGYQPTSGRNGYQPEAEPDIKSGNQPIRTTEQSKLPPPPSGGDATK